MKADSPPFVGEGLGGEVSPHEATGFEITSIVRFSKEKYSHDMVSGSVHYTALPEGGGGVMKMFTHASEVGAQ